MSAPYRHIESPVSKTPHFDVVVLIPHYNNLSGLSSSLSSIYHDSAILVVVVDDGSNDKHRPELSNLAKLLHKNVSLKVLYLKKNQGIERALNKGLGYIKDKIDCNYIARLDCGDTVRQNRFEVQRDYLEEHPNIFLVGSWVNFRDISGKKLFTYKPPANHRVLKKTMQMYCGFIHPAVMFRREALEAVGMYPTNYRAAEDYALFYRISRNFETANIRKTLTDVELNPNGISLTNRKLQLFSRLKVLLRHNPLSYRSFYGIGRTAALLFIPYRYVERIKMARFR